MALPHRTQIVYTPDMSFIAAHLGITPGAKVIEAGTGSGSFSHYLTRTVGRNHAQGRGIGWKGKAPEQRIQTQRNGRGRGRDDSEKETNIEADESEEEPSKKQPSDQIEAKVMQMLSQEPDKQVDSRNGRVWSFEFHAGRAVKAWNEFEDHGLFPTLSLRHRNVCKMGFGLQGVADAVFLDLPAPWEAIGHAAKALRSDVSCRICCFSPCVEQVLKTVEALRTGSSSDQEEEARWNDIETYECLNRNHMSVWAVPGGSLGNSSIEEAITRIRTVEEKKGKRREVQIERVKRERLRKLQEEGNEVTLVETPDDSEEAVLTGEKRKRDDEQASRKDKEASLDDAQVSTRTRDGKMLHRANIYARTFAEVSVVDTRLLPLSVLILCIMITDEGAHLLPDLCYIAATNCPPRDATGKRERGRIKRVDSIS